MENVIGKSIKERRLEHKYSQQALADKIGVTHASISYWENGVNIPAVCRSIMSEIRYVVTKNTGVTVKAVDVCVDSMTL